MEILVIGIGLGLTYLAQRMREGKSTASTETAKAGVQVTGVADNLQELLQADPVVTPRPITMGPADQIPQGAGQGGPGGIASGGTGRGPHVAPMVGDEPDIIVKRTAPAIDFRQIVTTRG